MADQDHAAQHPVCSLYLRSDGTLMLAGAEQALEIPLTAQQLLRLGIDCLSIATQLEPLTMLEALKAFESTTIVPCETPTCQLPN